MLYSTERDLMSDHDATQPPTSGSPRPDQGDEFNARTVLINQDMLDAARAEQQAPGQAPGAVPGAAPGAQAGSWRPVQPDLPTGPPPEEQTRTFSAGAAQAAAQPGTAPADPYIQANPYAQQGGLGQPAQLDQPAQPAQPAWGGSTAADGAAPASSPFAQSAPGIPSAPGTSSAPAAGAAPGAEASRETPHWPGQQPQAQPAGLQDQQPFAQQPAPHSHPFSGGRQEGEVGMSSVFPTATARAEAEQAASGDFVPGMPQPVAQSAPSSAPSVQSQGPVPPWGSVPSSDVAAGQAPPLSDMAPPTFGRPSGGDAMASVKTGPESADSVGSWVLALFLFFIPIVNLVYLLVLAFGSGGSATKKNWAKAGLIWLAIGLVLSVIAYSLLGAALWTTFSTAG